MSRHNKNKCFLERFCNPEYAGEFLSSKEIQLTDTLICPRKSYFSCFLFHARRSSARRGSTMTWRTIITDEKFLSLSLFLSSLFLAASFFEKKELARRRTGCSCGAVEGWEESPSSATRDDKSDRWRQLVPGKLPPHCTRDVLFWKIISRLFAC